MQMHHVLLPHTGLIAPSGMDGHGPTHTHSCLTCIAATSLYIATIAHSLYSLVAVK